MTTLTAAPLDYQRTAAALVHPLKLRILALMAVPRLPRPVPKDAPEPGWSPNSLSVAAGAPLSNVRYHVRELEKAGLIEFVATKPRRSARAMPAPTTAPTSHRINTGCSQD